MPEILHMQARDLIALINDKCKPSDRISIGGEYIAIEGLSRRIDGSGFILDCTLPESFEIGDRITEVEVRIRDAKGDLATAADNLSDISKELQNP